MRKSYSASPVIGGNGRYLMRLRVMEQLRPPAAAVIVSLETLFILFIPYIPSSVRHDAASSQESSMSCIQQSCMCYIMSCMIRRGAAFFAAFGFTRRRGCAILSALQKTFQHAASYR